MRRAARNAFYKCQMSGADPAFQDPMPLSSVQDDTIKKSGYVCG